MARAAKEGPHEMLAESRGDRRKSKAQEQARWNRENKLQWWNHSRSQLLASSLDLASIETPVRSPHPDHEGWLRWTCGTGAAISAFPLDARIGTETQANDCGYKTAFYVSSFPTVETCAYKEQLSTGME